MLKKIKLIQKYFHIHDYNVNEIEIINIVKINVNSH